MAEVTSRTVRYYIGQGLLPSPGMGPAAEYTPAHLDRLRLIKRLQRVHLPLAAIRARLEGMTDEQVTEMLAEPEPPPDSALDYVRGVLAESAPASEGRPSLRVAAPTFAAPASPARPSAPAGARGTQDLDPAAVHERSPGPGRSSWERIAVSPDIELHVRRPLSRPLARKVDRLVSIARDLLEEDPS
jgi:DNA-binding transcriptional MerR regulator